MILKEINDKGPRYSSRKMELKNGCVVHSYSWGTVRTYTPGSIQEIKVKK